jgi:hypothetical protein
MSRREEIEAERARAAREALDGVTRDGEVIGTSGFARTLHRAGDRLGGHFTARDADPGDRIEIWGRRIGRGLALVVVGVLIVHLFLTYGPR